MMYTILISQPEKNFHVNLSSEYYWGSVSRRVEVVEAVLVVVASDDKSINWCFCCFSVRKVNSWFTITWRSADPASLLLLASTCKIIKKSIFWVRNHLVLIYQVERALCKSRKKCQIINVTVKMKHQSFLVAWSNLEFLIWGKVSILINSTYSEFFISKNNIWPTKAATWSGVHFLQNQKIFLNPKGIHMLSFFSGNL